MSAANSRVPVAVPAAQRRPHRRVDRDMYRSGLDRRDRGGAIAAVVAIHAALLFALLHMSGKIDLADPQSVLRVFDVGQPPPPPPPPPQQKQPKPKAKEGGSAPKHI